jgi:hypothetical protein
VEAFQQGLATHLFSSVLTILTTYNLSGGGFIPPLNLKSQRNNIPYLTTKYTDLNSQKITPHLTSQRIQPFVSKIKELVP